MGTRFDFLEGLPLRNSMKWIGHTRLEGISNTNIPVTKIGKRTGAPPEASRRSGFSTLLVRSVSELTGLVNIQGVSIVDFLFSFVGLALNGINRASHVKHLRLFIGHKNHLLSFSECRSRESP